jgi:hypothetical protein
LLEYTIYALDIYEYIIRSDAADLPHANNFQFIKAVINLGMTFVDEDVCQPLSHMISCFYTTLSLSAIAMANLEGRTGIQLS